MASGSGAVPDKPAHGSEGADLQASPEVEPDAHAAPTDSEQPAASSEAADAEPAAADAARSGPGAASSPPTDEGDQNKISASADDESLAAHNVFGSVTRSLTLAGLLGAALVVWAQLTFRSTWVTEFLVHNELEMKRRMTLIASLLGGGGAVALGVAVVMIVMWRKKQDVRSLERFLWFLSPLILLPALPVLFRYKPWDRRHEDLLSLMLATVLVTEVFVARSLRSVPERLERWLAWLRERVPAFLKKHGPFLVVVTGTLFYVLFMSFYTLRWHYKLRTHNFDLSINNNLLYGAMHGLFMHSPLVFPDHPERYLATHAKIGQYLFLPIYALYPKCETLLVLQSVMLGAGALPLYAFAKKRVSKWIAALIALSYLCYYPMQGANFYEVKWLPIAGFFVIATVWAVDAKRWVLFGLAFVAAALMREDIPIGLAVVGVFLVLSGHRPRAGLIMAAVAGVWFVILRFYIMPAAGHWWFPDMYKGLWAAPDHGFKGVLKTALSNPVFTFSKIFTKKKILYLMYLLVPLALLPARRWYLWAAFIPGTVLTLFTTDYDPTIGYTFQYVMEWTPYLFLATPLALAAIEKSPDFGRSRMYASVTALALSTAVLQFNFGAFPRRSTFKGGFFHIDFSYSAAERERLKDLHEIIKIIPKDASVAASENVGPHVSSRVEMYSLRQGPHDAEYILISSRGLNLDNTKPKFTKAVKSGKYGVVKRIADFAVLEKGYSTKDNPKLLRDWHL